MADLLPYIVVGVATGCIYSIAAMGLVLTYRTTGLFNFAHGALGMAVAYAFYELRSEQGWPTALAILIALTVVAPLIGVIIDRLLFRSVATASTASKIVVTIGLLILLQTLYGLWYGTESRPVEPFLPTTTFEFADAIIGWDQVIIALIALAVLVGLSAFLRFARLGVAMRAVVDDAGLVETAGFPATVISSVTWALGVMLAGLAGILFAPLVELSPIALTLLVVKAFAAAIIGRLVSLPLTFAGGVLIGVLEATSLKVFENDPDFVNRLRPSLAFMVLFLALVFARKGRFRELGVSSPWQGAVRSRAAGPRSIAVLVIALLIATFTLSDSRVFILGSAIVLSCIFLSISVLTGSSGLINLGQAALVGTGAFLYIHMTSDWGVPFWLALPLAGLAVVPMGMVIAVPALRLPALFLALATFGFSQLVDGLLFGWIEFSGGQDGLRGTRPDLLQTDTRYVIFLIGMLALFVLVFAALRRTALGRTLIALRDSPTATETLGINPLWPKLAIFSLSAFLAGVAGGLYAGHLQVASKNFFFTFNSLVWVAVVVVGGVQSAYGAVLGAFLFTWAPELLQSRPDWIDYIEPLFGLGAILLARRPGGLMAMLRMLTPGRLITVQRATGPPPPAPAPPVEEKVPVNA